MKQIPKWFKLESAFIVALVIVTLILQSAITIVPEHDNEVNRLFLIVYGLLLVIWIISFIIVRSNGNKNKS